MSRQVNSGDPSSGFPSKVTFNQNGSISDADLTITGVKDPTKTIIFDASGQSSGKSITFAAGANSGNIVITLPTTSGTLATSGSGFANPMTTGGDVIYGGASGVATRLANGSNGQVLTSSGGTSAPTWTTVAAGFSDVSARAYHIPGGANIGNSLGLVKFDIVQYGGTWYNINGNDYSYSAPASGKYKINATILVAGSVAGDIVVIEIWKNGAAASSTSYYLDAVNLRAQATINDTIICALNDNITVMASCSSASPAIVSSNTKNVLCIDRIA